MKISDPEQPGKNYSLGCTSEHRKQLPTEYQRLCWQQQISLSCLRDSKYISVALELEQSKRMCLFWLSMWKTNASKGPFWVNTTWVLTEDENHPSAKGQNRGPAHY